MTARPARAPSFVAPPSPARGLRARVRAWLGGDAEPAGPPDLWLLALVVGLVAFGVVMVYSASAVLAHVRYGNGQHFLVRQAVFAAVGLTLALALSRVDYRRLRAVTYPFLLTSLALLVVVVGLGRAANGATRWIALGPVNVQPSELAKLALVLWLAWSLSRKHDRIRTFSIGFLPHALVAALMMALCLLQPDFGGAVMIALLTFVLLFTAGARLGYILGALLLFAPVAWWLVVSSSYRLERVRAFLDPFADPGDSGYQIVKSLLGFGSGGLHGVGLGDGRQKLLFLPEAHTDFIAAIVGEELGFVGVCLLVLAYGVLVARGLRAAFLAPDEHGTFLAVGISMFFGLQAFTNLAVVLGLLPTKGLVLPFVSYGGSSLLVNCAAVGILLDVSRRRLVTPPVEPRGATTRRVAASIDRAGGMA